MMIFIGNWPKDGSDPIHIAWWVAAALPSYWFYRGPMHTSPSISLMASLLSLVLGRQAGRLRCYIARLASKQSSPLLKLLPPLKINSHSPNYQLWPPRLLCQTITCLKQECHYIRDEIALLITPPVQHISRCSYSKLSRLMVEATNC